MYLIIYPIMFLKFAVDLGFIGKEINKFYKVLCLTLITFILHLSIFKQSNAMLKILEQIID